MRLKHKSDDSYWDLLAEIDEHGHGLPPWEIEFVEDLVKRSEQNPKPTLTKPQQIKIEEIHERRVT